MRLRRRFSRAVAAAVLGLVLVGGVLVGCTGGESGGESGAEHGSGGVAAESAGSERGEGSGEHGSGGEGSSEGRGESGGEGPEGAGEGSGEAGEAAMSSPILALGESWNGTLGGLAVTAWYDPATRSVHTTVQNTLPQVLCYVQAEPHLKSGTATVGELGPDVLGHLSPGQPAVSVISVDSEPALAGVAYDGYVIHMEVFDCGGTGPVAHGGEGAESGEGSGEGPGGEHGSGGERSGGGEAGETTGAGGEEASAATLAPGETFDMVRSGARLILSYDAASNSFRGTVENTTTSVLTDVRIEVHLSNGTELGPTTRVDMAPGEVRAVTLASTQAPFTGWIAHAEVGGGEGGGESGGEHGSGGEGGGESGGEHGSGGDGGSGR